MGQERDKVLEGVSVFVYNVEVCVLCSSLVGDNLDSV